NFGTFS
nr:Chain A, Segment of TAR DNA-binding protein 43 [Homo sapiens]